MRIRFVGGVTVVTALVVVSCGGNNGSSFIPSSDDAGQGTDGAGSLGPSSDASLGEGGSCAANAEGCSCPQVGQTAACWTGPPSLRHVGRCHDGTTQCLKNGELAAWGPCQGEELVCGVDAGAVDAAADVPAVVDAGCLTPSVEGRCPAGTYGNVPNPFGDGGIGCIFDGSCNFDVCCVPCQPSDCGDTQKAGCCLSSICAGNAACASCQGSQLPPACNGMVDSDCDDFPEDCDMLCCPCKPAGMCQSCPVNQIPCNGVCVDGVSDPSHCGACDHACNSGQQCVNGSCQ